MSELSEGDLKKLGIYFMCRAHCAYQDGTGTEAPIVIFAGADYEISDGGMGLREDAKYVNEPAIPYIRVSEYMTLRTRAETAETKLPEALDKIDALESDMSHSRQRNRELMAERDAMRAVVEAAREHLRFPCASSGRALQCALSTLQGET